ncbi:MAG: protein kinase [Anaerolineales bacterium]|nr:protein kinase [Anaerolineales bacterium]
MSVNICPQCKAENRISARFCAECGAPLLSGVSGPGATRAPALQVGAILQGRYQIVSELGRGGFGAVYRARDANVSRDCAIKENLDVSQEAQRQFAREASILANLSHPSLPRVTDHFVIVGQGQYLVMDFVEGEDLLSLVKRTGAIQPEQALSWIAQVADALTYIHSRKPPVVHRDIKPANIRITPDGKAMLVDFGLVKLYDPDTRTALGARAVTPGYAPPEQYGQGRTDARTDLYALGATLYNILTGRDPLESVRRMAGERLTPANEVNPLVPAHAVQVIEKAMAMDPEQRFQTAAEFKAALKSSGPLAGAPTSPGLSTDKTIRADSKSLEQKREQPVKAEQTGPGAAGPASAPPPAEPTWVQPVPAKAAPPSEAEQVRPELAGPPAPLPTERAPDAAMPAPELVSPPSGARLSGQESAGSAVEALPHVPFESAPAGAGAAAIKKPPRGIMIAAGLGVLALCVIVSLLGGYYIMSVNQEKARLEMEQTGVAIGRTQTAASRMTQTAEILQQQASTATAEAQQQATQTMSAGQTSTAQAIASATAGALVNLNATSAARAQQTSTAIALKTADAQAAYQATAKAPASWYIKALNSRVTSLNFFRMEGDDRKYTRKFDGDATTAIYYEANLEHNTKNYKDFTFTVIVYYPDGRVQQFDVDHYRESNWATSTHWSSWKPLDGGKFPAGTYQVDILVDGVKVATSTFQVE